MIKLSSNIRTINRIAISSTTKAVFIAVISFLVLFGAKVQGDDDRRQLWLISTRTAPLSGDLQSGQKKISYWRFSPDCQWLPADEKSFSAVGEPALPTTIIIHGNRDTADDAIEFAWPIYRRMLKIAQDRPFRLAIWSWPSERMCRRNRADVQLKFRYCDAQAYYLAACIERLPADVPLCLIGYSMGVPIAAGGLQLLAGGEVACRTLPNRDASGQSQKRSAPVRVVSVAAAIDDDSLATDGIYNLTLPQIEKMLLVRNTCDKVLKWYPRIYGRRGPEALGYVGPAGCGDYGKIELLDVSCEVGREHHWESYLSSPSMLASMDRYIFPVNSEKEIKSQEADTGK